MSRRRERPMEFTFMRFEVEVNMYGFPEDGGGKLAEEVGQAIHAGVMKFHGSKVADVSVKETTE